MKRSYLIVLISIAALTACKRNYDFKGANYHFERSAIVGQKSTTVQSLKSTNIITLNNADESGYIGPNNAIVACSKILFPSKDDAQKLFDENSGVSQDMQGIVISNEQLQEILPNAIIAYNELTDNPKVISIDDEQITYLDTLSIGDDERFWGMILQTVYFEFEMEDFKIRWYCNNSGTYKAKDVIVKRESDTEWKFIYNKVKVDQNDPMNNRYTIYLSDTRSENLFFWGKGDASNPTINDTLTHIAIRFIEDWNDESSMGGSLSKETMMITFGKTSTDEAGGGFGRVASDIIGFSISVIYQMADPGSSGTFGLMHNFETFETGKMKFSDIEQETSQPKQLYPVKSIEFDVQYDLAD